ncbi:MAG: DUF1588 domain-containing protein [Planctomycetes bacterium]|nr:DUF1588 domain-containing protein [Planctomycetota bacterium]
MERATNFLAGLALLGADEAPFDRLAPLVEQHCVACHRGAGAKGGLDLAAAWDGRSLRAAGRGWSKALARVAAGTMPPTSETPLAPESRAEFTAALRAVLAQREPGEVDDPGRVTLRRLSRVEYDRSVHDLLGVAWDSSALFPADLIAHGVDNLGDVMALPPMLFEKYVEASRVVVERLFADDALRERLLAPALARGGVVDDAAVRAIVAPLQERAFRRPIGAEELESRVALFRAQLAAGSPAVEALRAVVRSLLLAPDFLFRPETGDPAREVDGVRPLTDFELATRLAYFLTATLPDEPLLEAARAGQLADPEQLVAHARRLLATPGARTLADHFATGWLGFAAIRDVAVDIRRFGRFFAGGLRESLYEQVAGFFAAIVAEDRSVTELLDSDWTLLDARLAELYGLPAPSGPGLQRVALPDRRRGGLLGMGAVLTVTSFPLRTSPVLRGKWILETLLDEPPPPPPANVPQLPKDDRQDDALTLRQRLEQHRAAPACAGCHATMDPLGFALENFDAIGGWREQHDAPPDAPGAQPTPLDARAVLPDGTLLDGPAGLKEWLGARELDFLRTFTRRLFTYAVGRPPEFLDDATIDAIALAAQADGARFSAFVEGIVRSRPFRYLRAAEGGTR